jgi:hypothetical protein
MHANFFDKLGEEVELRLAHSTERDGACLVVSKPGERRLAPDDSMLVQRQARRHAARIRKVGVGDPTSHRG